EIIISARVDWIDNNNNVLKYGEKKDFCIPIKPKINRYQVGMYDDEGVLRATNGTDGQHGNLYVGQEARAKYTFTSENTWTSTNLLRGRAYEWKANSWQPSNAIGCNVSTDDANINKSAPYLMISPYENGLESFTVPDNTGNTEVINRVPFLLSSYWAKSPSHTKEETWIDIPVEKGNVAITDIQILHYLDHTRSELLGQGSTLFVGEEYAKFYTFKNYCNSPMKIEVWENTKQIEKAVFIKSEL
ncbi:MAG: hypothetical protein RR436_03875, partial [Clostridia bacterium]